MKALPCRISVEVSGVEAFLYNRSPVYDAIVQGIGDKKSSTDSANFENGSTSYAEKAGYRDLDQRRTRGSSLTSSSDENTTHSSSQEFNLPNLPPGAPKPTAPAFLRLLPVAVHCRKAAAVLGNENTETIITAKIDTAEGEFDASRAGPLDVFKILMGFEVSKISVQMKPNMDYRRPQLSEADILKSANYGSQQGSRTSQDHEIPAENNKPVKQDHRAHRSRKDKWAVFPGLSPKAKASLDSIATRARSSFVPGHLPNAASHHPGSSQWHGLSRYLEDNQQDEHDEWSSMEYAKASTLADISRLMFRFYWDVAGPRPYDSPSNNFQSSKVPDINGHKPPEYGMELVVFGGRVNYGPWADRNRINLQQIFFPMPYVDVKPMPSLRPGDTRLCTVFEISVIVQDDTVLRVPFREPSRDWKWKGRAANLSHEGVHGRRRQNWKNARSHKKSARHRKQNNPAAGADVRPFAWFDIKVKQNTTINYSMDMFAGAKGYRNKLKVDVSTVDIFSSLNHALLWRSGKISTLCDLSNPLAWSGLRQWVFDIHIHELDLFMLRDHTFLLVDLIADWSTGPLPEFFVFVPYRYLLNVHFHHSRLYLNVNDANIVNSSDDLDDNDFVILYSQSLDAELVVPLDRFRPAQNEITFDVNGRSLAFHLCLPAKNTQSTLLDDKDLAQLDNVNLKGSYSYCGEVQPGLTETLNLDIIGRGFKIAVYGFFARQLAKIKENYFGEDVHFRTLEEFQELAERNFEGSKLPQISLKSNDLDVILDITAEDARIIVPACLYSAKENLELTCDIANVDLRVSNYYLELMVNSSPLGLRHTSKVHRATPPRLSTSEREIFIDGVKVYGHRFFGFPPMEPPYVSNWDIDVGDILGHCSYDFLGKVVGAAQALAITIGDEENALSIPQLNLLHDTTFVRFRSSLIRIMFDIECEKLVLTVGNITGTFNDHAGKRFSQHLKLDASELSLACVDGSSFEDDDNAPGPGLETHAYLRTAISVEMIQRAAHFQDQKRLQSQHILTHDERGHRAPFLIQTEHWSSRQARQAPANFVPSLPLPILPTPLHGPTPEEQTRELESEPDCRSQQGRRKFWDLSEEPEVCQPWSKSGPLQSGDGGNPTPSKKPNPTFDPSHGSGPADSRRVNITSAPAEVFQVPSKSLKFLRMDLSDVPELPEVSSGLGFRDKSPSGNEIFNREYDEDSSHTSVFVQLMPGLTAMCKPQAIHSAINLLQTISPKDPEQVMDQYQYAVVSELLVSFSRKQGTNSILDVGVNLSHLHVRFINPFMVKDNPMPAEERDVFNVELQHTTFSARVRNMPEHHHRDDSRAMHLTIESLSLSAQEDHGTLSGDIVAFQAVIDDVLMWLVDGDRMSIHGSYHSLGAALSSSKVSYLASLLHRTTLLADDLQHRVSSTMLQQKARLRFLVYNLVKLGENVADPSFLTRPTYVLRTTKSHIRSSDSWKITLRLRYVLLSLSTQDQADLVKSCARGQIECPEEAESYVLESLDQWRSWDAIHVKDSIAMRTLYGNLAGVEKLHDRGGIPISLTLRGSGIKLRVDPGGSQNLFGIEELAVYVAIIPPPPPSALQFFHDVQERKSTTVQVDTMKVTLQLNWGLYELVDQLFTLFENEAPHLAEAGIVIVQNDKVDWPATEQFHIVYTSQLAMVSIDTPNLIQELHSDNLRFSLAGAVPSKESSDSDINALASADSASMKTKTRKNILSEFTVNKPSLWTSLGRQVEDQQITQIVQIAGDSDEVSIQIKQSVPRLLQVVDRILVDEAASMRSLILRHSQKSQHLKQGKRSRRSPANFKIQVGLFLKHYRFRIPVMDDADYLTTGQGIRVAVCPGKDLDSSLQIDFDLKAQSHCLLKNSLPSNRPLAKIEMPPINGRLRLLVATHVLTASGALSLEKISIDGADTHGIVSVVSLPEFINEVDSIRANMIALSKTYQAIFPSSGDSHAEDKPRARPFIFDVNAVLAGLSMVVSESQRSRDSAFAQLVLNLGSTQVRAANRSAMGDKPLPFPEVRLLLGRIEALLHNKDSKVSHFCGRTTFQASLVCAVEEVSQKHFARIIKIMAAGPEINVGADTAPQIVRLLGHLQDRVKSLNLFGKSKHIRKLQTLGRKESRNLAQPTSSNSSKVQEQSGSPDVDFVTEFVVDFQAVRVSYIEPLEPKLQTKPVHHLAFTVRAINLTTRSEEEARLKIDDIRLQLLPHNPQKLLRPSNSAVLPEVLFTVSQDNSSTERKLLFQAIGKVLDVQIDTHFPLPASQIANSLADSIERTRSAIDQFGLTPAPLEPRNTPLFGRKRLSLLIVDANFAGAAIRLHRMRGEDLREPAIPSSTRHDDFDHGRFGQFGGESSSTIPTLHAPGIATKLQYSDPANRRSSIDVEIRVDNSNNEMKPAVGPLILQLYNNIIKAIQVSESSRASQTTQQKPTQRKIEEGAIVQADPRAILGRTKLNVGFRICRQEITLSCQPNARVSANMRLEDTYITINNLESSENGRFFTLSATFAGLNASLKHAYSRDPTFSFDMQSVVLSLMNSKHISGVSGISAILRINPTKAQVNAKQWQDILLFGEIWVPPEVRNASSSKPKATSLDAQDIIMHRYQQIAAAATFPWNATIAIAELSLELDLGQAIGKLSSRVSNFWVSSKKTTDSQQTLCLGIDGVYVQSSGRMSGFVELDHLKVRTSIAWPKSTTQSILTPLIQGSLGFNDLKVKAAFDYQAFAIAHITSFEFIMYNVRDRKRFSGDRLVAILDGGKVQVYCTALSAALGLSLVQAFERLIQEKRASYEEAVRDIEKLLRRKSAMTINQDAPKRPEEPVSSGKKSSKMPISLHTDVIVTIEDIHVGVFPRTFVDPQVLNLEASTVQARFDVSLESKKIHSGLGLNLGQVRVALSSVPRASVPKTLGGITIEDVTRNATSAGGGIILRVPRVVSIMQTWQAPDSNSIDFIFKSTFEGKIDVGWNYSRISFIRGMWATHSRSFAARLGKPLPESALKITGPEPLSEQGEGATTAEPSDDNKKITAVVNLPQSKYVYNALEPPVIDTPQLRDMGEATPPLEWIGLHRDRLPNVTHQIVIVTLLEVAKEVEDAYSRILGSA